MKRQLEWKTIRQNVTRAHIAVCVSSIQSSQGANLWEVDLASIIEVMITQIFFPKYLWD